MVDATDPAFVAGDLDGVRKALDSIDLSAARVSRSLSRAFAEGVVQGKGFEDMLKGIGAKLSGMALDAALKPAMSGLAQLASSSFSGFGAGAGAIPVTPFAEGGVVAAPTFFGSGGGLGLMGERGAEAIVPLARGPDGRLGLAGAATGRPVQVSVSIQTPNAESFRRSEAQVSAAIARAVARGQRGL